MNRLETYKEIYQKEIDRKSQLNNDLSIPMALISLLATGVFFYLTNFDFACDKILYLIFISLILIGTFFLVKAIYFLLRSYLLLVKTVEYDYLAYPNEIEDYYQTLKVYAKDVLNDSETEALETADTALENYFIAGYLRTSTKNMGINDERSANLFRSKREILYSLIILLLAFIPYLINNFTKNEKIPKIEISNGIILTCDTCISSKLNKYMATSTNNPNPTPPPPPPPPPPPRDRHVKEGEIPTKPNLNEGDKR